MPMDPTRNQTINIQQEDVEYINTRLRLLQEQASRAQVSQAGKMLIENTFDTMIRCAVDIELLLDQHTEYPTRGH